MVEIVLLGLDAETTEVVKIAQTSIFLFDDIDPLLVVLFS